jgi:uncharacterized membrane protein YjjB (DUF3815 family)
MLASFVIAFVASAGWAVLFVAPPKTLLWCGVTGALGWTVMQAFALFSPSVNGAVVLAAFAVGVVCEVLSRWQRQPATVYCVAGVVPLVPGVKSYEAMMAFAHADYIAGVSGVIDTLFIAGAIAGGLAISGALMRYVYQRGHRQ